MPVFFKSNGCTWNAKPTGLIGWVLLESFMALIVVVGLLGPMSITIPVIVVLTAVFMSTCWLTTDKGRSVR